MELYQKTFTGEIPPLIITTDTPDNDTMVVTNTLEPITYKELSIIKWRDIAKKHLPYNADINSVEFEFKLEYLHIDYELPSLTPVPSSKIPVQTVQDTNVTVQVKVAELKQNYNVYNGYGKEIRLIRHYDYDYTLNNNNPDNYSNDLTIDPTLKYPIMEILYNNRLPGFLDLIPYLLKNGNLTFADIKQELRLQIISNLGNKDTIAITGGYSGSVTYELKKPKIETTTSRTENLTTLPVKILDANQDRYGFYICNNSQNDIYFSFGNNAPSLALKLTLKPDEMLVYEHGQIYVDGTVQNTTLDNRVKLGTPIWARASVDNSVISIEELSFIYN